MSVLLHFEEYQKARVKFVQAIAEAATRPQNIEVMNNAGVMQLLRPLLLDNVPSIQQTAALALGRLANYSEDLAEAVVGNEILPQLVYSLSDQNVSTKPWDLLTGRLCCHLINCLLPSPYSLVFVIHSSLFNTTAILQKSCCVRITSGGQALTSTRPSGSRFQCIGDTRPLFRRIRPNSERSSSLGDWVHRTTHPRIGTTRGRRRSSALVGVVHSGTRDHIETYLSLLSG